MKTLAIIWGGVLVGAIMVVAMFYWVTTPVQGLASDKYDGDCSPQDTVGRCADKCPPNSYQIGNDKETGAAICKNNPTGCPYGDSVPLGPECDRLAPQQPPVDNVPAPNVTDGEFQGK